MRLYMLRHAEAEETAASDRVRLLTGKGEQQARRVGKFCAQIGIEPEVILTSPFLRAADTARLVAGILHGVKVLEVPFLASGMQPETALAELRPFGLDAGLMLVGHEPDFSWLAAFLLGLPLSGNIHIRKASLALIDVESLDPLSASLEFLIPVKLMNP